MTVMPLDSAITDSRANRWILRRVFLVIGLFLLSLHGDIASPHAASATADTSSILYSPLLSFNWSDSSGQGFCFYTDSNTDHGDMSGGNAALHGYSINKDGNGLWEVWADQGIVGSSWHGRWISLAGTAAEKTESVRIIDPLPARIRTVYRIAVTGIRFRLKGNGRWKVELKYPDNSNAIVPIVIETESPDRFIEHTIQLPHNLKGPVKFLNVVVESRFGQSHLWFDAIDFVCRVPKALMDDPLRYGALVSYARLLACLNDDGTVKDHLNFPAGDFDSVPAMGFQIYAAACAQDLGFITTASAKRIAKRCADRLIKIPAHKPSGLLPHFLRDGRRHPQSEWSSVDTALALVPAWLGLKALGLDVLAEKLHTQRIAAIDFSAFTNAANELTHGFDTSGKPLTGVWNHWDGELISLLLLRALHDPELHGVHYSVQKELFHGRAFLYEMSALWSSAFAERGKDRNGIDWRLLRGKHLKKQKAFGKSGIWWGLDPVEIMRGEDAATTYLEAGVGTRKPKIPALYTLDGYGSSPWFAPHYAVGFVAALEPAATGERIAQMRDDALLLFPPLLGPPESVQVDISGPKPVVIRCHRVSTSLNLFFSFAGLYSGICARDGREQVIHQVESKDSRFRDAVAAVH